MPSTIAALPSSSYIPPDAERDAGWDVPEYAFSELWQDRKEGLSFGDLLDIVNPLQHIPVVSSIYRMIAGDEIGVGARLAGGALFGGPIGALAAGAVAAFEGASGKTVDRHVAALFEDAPEAAPASPQIAAVAPDDFIAIPGPLAVVVTPLPAPEKPAPEPGLPATDPRATATEPPQPASDAAAERRRVAQAVEQAQRAQAGLLLASLEADRAAARQAGDGSDADAADAPAQPFRQHPYMLPPGAPPQLISRAMEQALLRYQSMLQQRESGAITQR